MHMLYIYVLNAAFYMTCGLLMLVEDARGDNMETASHAEHIIENCHRMHTRHKHT